jgi:host factor-I protein
MGTLTDHRAGDLDTSRPGVRQIQSWIRDRVPLSVQLLEGGSLSGVPAWQDAEYLALHADSGTASSRDLVLINRLAIALLRPLA